MKIKMPFLTLIFVVVVVAVLIISTFRNSAKVDHSEHENMPQAADQMEKAKR